MPLLQEGQLAQTEWRAGASLLQQLIRVP
jgi:hypothetical protein